MATQIGRYIDSTEVDNFGTATDVEIKRIIDRSENMINKVCQRIFYEKSFDVRLDGNGRDRVFLTELENIQYVSAYYVNNVSQDTTYLRWNDYSVFISQDSGISSNVELKYTLRDQQGSWFPKGMQNIRIVGTYGLPRRLDFDGASGAFTLEELITGGTSGATAYIKEINTDDGYMLIVGLGATNFQNDEEFTGDDSEETADVNNTSGAIYYPPDAIREATIILCRYANDETLYTFQIGGKEDGGAYTYERKTAPLTGLVEVDRLIADYVSDAPQFSA